MTRTLFAAALSASLAACNTGFEEVWQLKDFRILGVRSDPAEVMRGGTVNLQLITADPRNRTVDAIWFGCATPIDPRNLAASSGGSSGPLGGCAPQNILLATGTTRPRFTIPMQGGTPDARGRESISLIGFACAGGRFNFAQFAQMLMSSEPSSFTSFPTPTCLGPGDTDTKVWQFTRSLAVRNPTTAGAGTNPLNRNPEIASVWFGRDEQLREITDATAPTPAPCADIADRNNSRPNCPKYHLDVIFTPESRESYQDVDPLDPASGRIVTRTERLTLGWVVDGGRLAGGFRSDSDAFPMARFDNDFYAAERPGTYTLHLYAIDGRGGFAYTSRTITVQ